jgi:hypothetical protein
MKITDNLISIRILHLLNLPFDKWKAYQEGIINKEGEILKDNTTSDNWTMLHRLICRLKVLLAKVPGGSTKIGTMIASYLLVKEKYEMNDEKVNDKELIERKLSFKDYIEYMSIIEDGEVAAPANVAGNIAMAEVSKDKKKKENVKIIKRQQI